MDGWTGILHHFETMGSLEAIVGYCWLVFTGEANHCRDSTEVHWISQPSGWVSTQVVSIEVEPEHAVVAQCLLAE